jgi:SAM-dependent methyltransferase
MGRVRRRAQQATPGARLWPGGPSSAHRLYTWTGRVQARSREARYRRFDELVAPRPELAILDVGVTNATSRFANFLEARYPYPERITAVTSDPNLDIFRAAHPAVTAVVADGRSLPFEDRAFDVAFSNAVIEHVGSREEQRRFVGELCRVADLVFVATPNPAFPVELHTLLPFVHWLPRPVRRRIYRTTGRGFWADEANLNLIPARELVALFPPEMEVTRVGRPGLRALAPVTTVWAVRRRARGDTPPDGRPPTPPT